MQTMIILAVVVFLLCVFCAVCFAQEIDWRGIVVHHSGSDNDTFGSIDRYHRSKGWDGCGYHYVIERDGTVREGRPLSKYGAHALTGKPYSRNKTHIGICLPGTNDFTLDQRIALTNLCRKLNRQFELTSIERHHSVCPGPGLDIEGLERSVIK